MKDYKKLGNPGYPLSGDGHPRYRPRYLMTWERLDTGAAEMYRHNYSLMRLEVLEEIWGQCDAAYISVPINTGWC